MRFGSPERAALMKERAAEKRAILKDQKAEFMRIKNLGSKVTAKDLMSGLKVSILSAGGFEKFSEIMKDSPAAFMKGMEMCMKYNVPLNTVVEHDIKGNFVKIPTKQAAITKSDDSTWVAIDVEHKVVKGC